ncbi:multiprotein-bridging factor 1 family protein [Nonomuraea sp. NPDC052265]|uniref:multiprotein-bridging factor 1 family protein n=1 Tax=Nonomuraea sp. NPDC052265 TaxID=3364374 RepID=UPI0037CC94F8
MLDTPHSPARIPTALLAAVKAADYPLVVRLARQRASLTQEQLGAVAGYSAATVFRLETGRQPLHDIATLRCLAQALAIPCDWLGQAQEPASGPSPARAFTPSAAGPAIRVDPSAAGEEQNVKRRHFLASVAAGPALLSVTASDTVSDTTTARLERS